MRFECARRHIKDINQLPPSLHRWVLGSSDFDIFLKIQYASCDFSLALKS
jgi:hypothetical protein